MEIQQENWVEVFRLFPVLVCSQWVVVEFVESVLVAAGFAYIYWKEC